MEYKVLRSSPEETIANVVTRHLKDGWELYGSPCVTAYPVGAHSSQVVICQAITREENKEQHERTKGITSNPAFD